MILWLTGNTGSGKTTLSKRLQGKNVILLDGDELRVVWPGLGLEKESRIEQNLRAARLAKLLESQGFAVVVAVICPYEDLRDKIRRICNCLFIYLPGGKEGEEYPYEVPKKPDLVFDRQSLCGTEYLLGLIFRMKEWLE